MWTLACLGGSVPRLATRLRAGTHAGSTATHDPQPIRSFVSLKRVPRPRARSSIRTRRVRFFVSSTRASFLFFFFSPSTRFAQSRIDRFFQILVVLRTNFKAWSMLGKRARKRERRGLMGNDLVLLGKTLERNDAWRCKIQGTAISRRTMAKIVVWNATARKKVEKDF